MKIRKTLISYVKLDHTLYLNNYGSYLTDKSLKQILSTLLWLNVKELMFVVYMYKTTSKVEGDAAPLYS